MSWKVERLDAAREGDFWRFHAAGYCNWCFCAAWTVPSWEDWGERTSDQNRAVRAAMFDTARYDGFLAYDGAGQAVGWLQCAPLAWFPKLYQQMHRTPEPGVYALGCFLVAPDSRRQGVARALLAGALEWLDGADAVACEAFPRRGVSGEGEVWTGPESLLVAAGFRVVVDDSARPVLRRECGA